MKPPMGRYSLWVQVPLQLLAVSVITFATALFALATLHDTPVAVQIIGGLTIGVVGQLAARKWVLGPWQDHVSIRRTLIQVWALAEKKRAEAEQPHD